MQRVSESSGKSSKSRRIWSCSPIMRNWDKEATPKRKCRNRGTGDNQRSCRRDYSFIKDQGCQGDTEGEPSTSGGISRLELDVLAEEESLKGCATGVTLPSWMSSRSEVTDQSVGASHGRKTISGGLCSRSELIELDA